MYIKTCREEIKELRGLNSITYTQISISRAVHTQTGLRVFATMPSPCLVAAARE